LQEKSGALHPEMRPGFLTRHFVVAMNSMSVRALEIRHMESTGGPTDRQNGNRQRNRGIQNFAPIFPVLPNHPLYRSEVFGILHKSLISKSSVGGILLTTQFIAGNYSCRSTAKK
jgi:hypothetical protein